MKNPENPLRKVVGIETERNPRAAPGEQIVHLAKLECGHLQPVGHGDVPDQLRCLDCEPEEA